MTTISELVCQARGITPVLGTLRGICVYCQRETDHGHKHKDDPSGCATYHTIRGGTVICPHCHHMRSERWAYRSSMWEASSAGFRQFKFEEAQYRLLHPPDPPFAQFYTRTWKKNGWQNMINEINLSRDRYTVALDYDIIHVSAERRDRMMSLAEGLLAKGARKSDLASGELGPKAVIALGPEALPALADVRRYASDPLWDLIVYVAHGPKRKVKDGSE